VQKNFSIQNVKSLLRCQAGATALARGCAGFARIALTRLDNSQNIERMSRSVRNTTAVMASHGPSAEVRVAFVSMLIVAATVVLIWGLRGVT
jgi:hypothetical protein